MLTTKDRLIRCFAGVFPEVEESELPSVSVGSLAEWDSLRGITLMTVIEQEFGVQIPDEELERFISFDLIFDFVSSEAGDGSS